MFSDVSSAILPRRAQLLTYPSLSLALSGGQDSVVLLHALVQADLPIRALHVHHGLQAEADAWADFCLELSRGMGIPCEVKHVQVVKQSRRGLEDSARSARYEALWQFISPFGALLTAHHQRDQAETFLLRLLRGAGVKGLSGMREISHHDSNRHLVRPLLSVSHLAIADYAQKHGLTWVEDPSNQETNLRRNYFRHKVLPLLTPHQPEQAIGQLAQTCEHLAEASALLDIMAQEDWQKIATRDKACDLSVWRALPWARAKQVLSWRWQALGGSVLARGQWEEIKHQFYATSAPDRHPQFRWKGFFLQLGAGELWILTDKDLSVIAPVPLTQTSQAWGTWGLLTIHDHDPEVMQGWYWRMRQQGDAVITEQGHKRLKEWLQKHPTIPNWQKQRWPVLCDAENQLVTWADLSSHPTSFSISFDRKQ